MYKFEVSLTNGVVTINSNKKERKIKYMLPNYKKVGYSTTVTHVWVK